jgi:two-component system cell cycle response regulator DivK
MTHTILYIEDNPDNMLVVQRAVEMLECNFLWAATGYDGLQMAEAQRPNLILLDINLPDIDGYQIARRLRAGDGPLTTVPIIAVTANALKGDAERALESGCTAHMPKPINTRELRQRIMAILSNAEPQAQTA